jgi:putative oxidoreductase
MIDGTVGQSRADTWITPNILNDSFVGLSRRFPIAHWAPIPLRVIVGYGFMEHGFARLSKGTDTFAAVLQGMGVPASHLMARLTTLIELLGDFAVILGAFVSIVTVPMAAVLLVAMFKVRLPYGFSSMKLLAVTAADAKFGPVGYEVNLLYIASLAALVMRGSGPFAVDRLIGDAISNHQTCGTGSNADAALCFLQAIDAAHQRKPRQWTCEGRSKARTRIFIRAWA